MHRGYFIRFLLKKDTFLRLLFWGALLSLGTFIDIPLSTYAHDVFAFDMGAWGDFFFKYAPLPSWIACFIFAVILLRKRSSPFLKRSALVVLFSFIVGCGFITHLLLKEGWGRPRPKQTVFFGGTHTYYPWYLPAHLYEGGKLRSFPSGHGAITALGLVFLEIGLASGRKKWVLFGMIWCGVLMLPIGILRIFQGGHYFTDVVMAAAVMDLTAFFTSYYIIYSSKTFNGVMDNGKTGGNFFSTELGNDPRN